MKIGRRLAILALAFVGSAGALSAAPKIGVLLKARIPYWAAMEKGAEEAGSRLGVDVVVKAPLDENDVAVQVQLLNALAAQGAQAIVIAASNQDRLRGPVEALAAKGIKIVAIDSTLTADGVAAFVGTNQRAAGETAGALIAGVVNDGDEVCFFKHTQLPGAATDREQGALEKLRAARPNIVIHGDIYASTEAGTEKDRAQALLDKYPNAKVILASGTPGTMAMLELLEAKGTKGSIKFAGFGFNLNPEVAAGIDDGTMMDWIAQQPGEVGAKGVETAVALLNGQSVPPVTYVDVVVVSKDNLKDPKVQALLQ